MYNVVSFRTSFWSPFHPQRPCLQTYQKRQKTDPILRIEKWRGGEYCLIALGGMDVPGLRNIPFPAWLPNYGKDIGLWGTLSSTMSPAARCCFAHIEVTMHGNGGFE